MRYALIFLFSLLSCFSFSQNTTIIDSLQKELKNSRHKSEILNKLADKYLRISPEESLKYAEKAMDYALREDDKAQMAEALWMMARVYLSYYNYPKSILYIDSAKSLFLESGNAKAAINCEVARATTHMLQGESEEALEIYKNCAQQALELDAKPILASVLINIGRIDRVRGNYKDAMDNFQKVREIAIEINDGFLLAHAYHFIGLVNQDNQNFELAIENYLKSLPLFEQEDMQSQIAYVLISLGSSCRDSKNYTESLKYLKQATSYFDQYEDTWGRYELNRNMGLSYMELEKYDSAWICFQKSLKYSKEINERAGECNALNYMGEILVYQHKYNEALKYLEQALSINTQLNNKLSQTNILFNIGKCKVSMGDYVEGLRELKKSLVLADSLNVIYEKMIIHKEISTAYIQLRQYEKALRHYQDYSELNDSIYREEANRSFVEMEKKYQSEKQKQEISQLNFDKVAQEVSIRKQRSARNIFIAGFIFATLAGLLFYRSYKTKKKADQEKEALLKEIHHRVKNNLQIISSLLSIQTDNVSDAKVINAVQESQSRVKAMALIHQLLYQDQDLSHINFGTYLPQLVNALSSIFKKKGITVISEIDAEGISFDIDTAVPLGLIVAELTSNAYKYAFDEKTQGMIKIEVKNTQEKEYLLTVADNGPGLPKDTNIKELDSMGLRLVNILTDQLDGIFDYKYNNGSVFTVKLTNSI